MSDNSLLVRFFIKETFNNNAYNEKQLAYLISPDFAYYLDVGCCMNYNQFIERIKRLFSSSTVQLGNIASDDDIHFYCDLKVNSPEFNQTIETYGLSQIIVRNGFIEQVTINYHENQKQFIEFKSLIKNKTTVFL